MGEETPLPGGEKGGVRGKPPGSLKIRFSFLIKKWMGGWVFVLGLFFIDKL